MAAHPEGIITERRLKTPSKSFLIAADQTRNQMVIKGDKAIQEQIYTVTSTDALTRCKTHGEKALLESTVVSSAYCRRVLREAKHDTTRHSNRRLSYIGRRAVLHRGKANMPAASWSSVKMSSYSSFGDFSNTSTATPAFHKYDARPSERETRDLSISMISDRPIQAISRR